MRAPDVLEDVTRPRGCGKALDPGKPRNSIGRSIFLLFGDFMRRPVKHIVMLCSPLVWRVLAHDRVHAHNITRRLVATCIDHDQLDLKRGEVQQKGRWHRLQRTLLRSLRNNSIEARSVCLRKKLAQCLRFHVLTEEGLVLVIGIHDTFLKVKHDHCVKKRASNNAQSISHPGPALQLSVLLLDHLLRTPLLPQVQFMPLRTLERCK
mmetsp:Transcript_24589/g.62218  ORF Transcript_24589/g.62218 Transcript_24589/m.62218 type:complete len:207 (+) Transcript_24589:240-860(+)